MKKPLTIFSSLRVQRPCAKACCARPSMQKKFRAHIPYLKTCPNFSLHSAVMCGGLVVHANTQLCCVPLHRIVRSLFRCISIFAVRSWLCRALDVRHAPRAVHKKIRYVYVVSSLYNF